MTTESQPALAPTESTADDVSASPAERPPAAFSAAIAAFLISPAVGVLVFGVGMCASAGNQCEWGSSIGLATVLLPFAWSAGIALGVPAFFLMRRFGLTNAWQVALGGGIVASLGAAAVLQGSVSAASVAAMFIVPGGAAGLTFWRLVFYRSRRR